MPPQNQSSSDNVTTLPNTPNQSELDDEEKEFPNDFWLGCSPNPKNMLIEQQLDECGTFEIE